MNSNIFNLTNLLAILISLAISVVLVPLVIKLAVKNGAVDNPKSASRKIHQLPTPLLGGLPIFISFFIGLFVFRFFGLANFSLISDNFILALFISSLLIMIGGVLDDKYSLRPWQQIIWPIGATLVVLLAGMRIGYISNPFGTELNTIIYLSPIFGMILSFFWLMGMMYTTKFLDGLDGLVAGISMIASAVIFFLSQNWDVQNSATGVMALLLLGATLGFWIFNWRPAKIFLGEGGSIFLGFILGVLSIISGSKISTTLLVMGIPALDVLWVIIQRLSHHESPFSHADKKHLHFRLLDLGFSKVGAVLFLYFVALSFGLIAVWSDSWGKIIGLFVLLLIMIFLITYTYKNNKK